MAKKESFWNSIKEGISMFADVGLNLLIGNIKSAATNIMEEAQERIEEVVKKVMKAIIVSFIMLFGLIMAIIGLGKFLSETVSWLNNGLGYVLIGGVIIVLGIIVQMVKSK